MILHAGESRYCRPLFISQTRCHCLPHLETVLECNDSAFVIIIVYGIYNFHMEIIINE